MGESLSGSSERRDVGLIAGGISAVAVVACGALVVRAAPLGRDLVLLIFLFGLLPLVTARRAEGPSVPADDDAAGRPAGFVRRTAAIVTVVVWTPFVVGIALRVFDAPVAAWIAFVTVVLAGAAVLGLRGRRVLRRLRRGA